MSASDTTMLNNIIVLACGVARAQRQFFALATERPCRMRTGTIHPCETCGNCVSIDNAREAYYKESARLQEALAEYASCGSLMGCAAEPPV